MPRRRPLAHSRYPVASSVITKTCRIVIGYATLLGALSCAPKNPAPATTQPISTPQDLTGLRNFAWVTPFLARGGQPTATGFVRLKERGIKTVVDLRGKTHRDDVAPGMRYLQLPTNVSKPELKQVVE